MDRLRLSVFLPVFGTALKPALQAAAVTGATGVLVDVRGQLKPAEFSDSARRHLRRYLEELGLVLAAATFPTRRAFADPQDLDARVTATCQAMLFARQLGINVLTLRLGSLPDATPDEAGHSPRGALLEVLNDLARYGNHVGTVPTVAATTADPEALLELLGQVDGGPIGVDFDPAGFAGRGSDPVAAYRLLYEYVQHIRVRDAVRESDGQMLEVPLGRGEVAWDEMLAVIDEAEYGGWLTAERTTGDDPAGDVARAVAWVRAVAMG